jgi:hypothetical protein
MLITVTNAVMIYALIEFLYSHGLWRSSPRIQTSLSIWGALSFILSLTCGVVALSRDASKGCATLALCLSLLSFLFYVQ